jgi:SAM-dependent methyltransferase
LFEELGYAARQCGCGVLYTTPAPRPGLIDPTDDLHQESYYELAAPMRLEFLQRHRPSGSLLEVGCGNGYFLRLAQARGYSVTGMEPNPVRANHVRSDLGIPVENALIEDTLLPEASFDIVYHCDLLSHFPDPVLALSRMASLTKTDGVLYFEVGLVAGLASFWYQLMGTMRMPQHRWFFTQAALENLLAQCGLQIVRLKRYGLAPGLLISHFGRLTGLGGGATRRADVAARKTESRQRSQARAALRYRLGAMTAGVGPETALVIARHCKDGKKP